MARKAHFKLGYPADLFKILKQDLVKESSLSINVKRYFTDVDGQIIDKTTLPENLKTSIPFYLFGTFDYEGSYYIGRQFLPVDKAWKYLYTRVVESQYDFLQFTGLNNVKDNFSTGDIVTIYTDDLNAPTYFCFLVIHCPSQSYASVLRNLGKTVVYTRELLYYADNPSNYTEIFHIPTWDHLGVSNDNLVPPLSYNLPINPQDDFLRIPLIMTLNQYIGFYSKILFTSELLNFEFVTSIEQMKTITI